jgi:NAD(P)-dependent dehydrogenase (short-subunit alcohol dehydrogenase family)
MTGRMSGKAALVTGAASPIGIGFAAARRLALEGASVVLADIDEAGVEAGARRIRAPRHPSRHMNYRCRSAMISMTNGSTWRKSMHSCSAAFSL